MRHAIVVMLIWLVAWPLTSCEPEVDYLTWTPVDRQRVQSALLKPTANVDVALLPDFQAFLEQVRWQIVEQQMISAQLIDGLWELSAEQPPSNPDTDYFLESQSVPAQSVPVPHAAEPGGTIEETSSNGTSLFLRVACPGPSIDFSDRGFDQGEIRIDSTELTAFSDFEFLNGSDLLLQFLDCQTPTGTINASAAGWVSDSPVARIVMDLSTLGLELGGIQITAADFRATSTHMLVDVSNVGTFRLTVTVSDHGDVSLLIIAADGIVRCVYQTWGSNFLGCNTIT